MCTFDGTVNCGHDVSTEVKQERRKDLLCESVLVFSYIFFFFCIVNMVLNVHRNHKVY